MAKEVGMVSEEEYSDATNDYQGWCTTCQEFNGESCEPDAEHYECPVCGENTCYGAEQALVLGLIDIE